VSHDHTTAPPAPSSPGGGTPVTPLPGTPPPIKSTKLITTLTVFGAIAGALIVTAFQLTKPRIDRHKAEVLQSAAKEVLGQPATVRTVFIYRGQLLDSLPAGVDSAGLDRVYLGTDGSGQAKGFAVTAGEPGFSDVISLIFGYEPATGRIIGMKVLEQKETPGLGDRVEKDSTFVHGFAGALSPIKPVKHGQETADKHEVDTITGATISSRAVVNIINHRLEKIGPLLKGYAPRGQGGRS